MRLPFEDSSLVREVRENGFGHHFIIEAIKFVVVIAVADAVTNKLPRYVIDHGIEPFASLPGIWLIAIGLLSFVALAYCAIWERMRPRQLGVRFAPPKKTGLGLLAGYAAGAGLIAASLGLSLAFGAFSVEGNAGNALAGSLAWMFAVYLFQAFGEEVMYRGAFMMAVARKNSAITALVLSSLVFSLHHHFNQGYGPIAFVNLFLLALLLGATVFITNRIWAATALHGAWNFFQGNVFGVNVSGAAPDLTSTLLVSTPQGNALVTGGAMGLEGSLATTAVLVVALVAVVFWVRSRNDAADEGQTMEKPSSSSA